MNKIADFHFCGELNLIPEMNDGSLAQLVERLFCTQEVLSSNLKISNLKWILSIRREFLAGYSTIARYYAREYSFVYIYIYPFVYGQENIFLKAGYQARNFRIS